MSEFNGRKFYGYSLHNDPALTTSTRNFEFKYTRPEQLERAIQKVQSTDIDKQKKSALLNKYCKVKKSPKDEPAIPQQNYDNDIETHVSRHDFDSLNRIRTLSANEIDLLIGKVRSSAELPASTPNLAAASEKSSTASVASRTDRINELEEQYRKLKERHQHEDGLHYVAYEEYHEEYPQWVEILATPKLSTVTVAEIIEPEVKQSNYGESLNTKSTKLPLQPVGGIMTINGEAGDGATYNMPNLASLTPFEPIDQDTYYVEDSDLEYEMMGRADYTKFCGPRPKEDELLNASNDSGGFPEFIEVEPQVPCMDLSFLKNASPMRYSDLTDETQEELNRTENSHMKVFIKPSKQEECQTETQQDTANSTTKATPAMSEKETNTNKKSIGSPKPKKKTSKSKTAGGATQRKDHSGSPRPRYSKAVDSNTSSPISHSPRQRAKAYSTSLNSQRNNIQQQSNNVSKEYGTRTVHHHVNNGVGVGNSNNNNNNNNNNVNNNNIMLANIIDIRSIKNIVLTKSIEELKMEKAAIFSKMTSTQERIIEMLDKLRINLLEMYVPDNSYEKTKRQKNAFEFSVRFSRNFLYPLKGMIEDLRVISIEQLNSASSNEACSRVATIFALIKQSLETYHKQLRFFLLDQVPQKLNSLIEMISAAVNICLEKGVFDPNDAIIDCLQDRCKKFINFLEDMHEERFLTARENYRKSPSNYNLKMFMNDLNMYEPKLIPKHVNCRTRRSSSNAPNAGPSCSGINQRKMVGKRSSSDFTDSNNTKEHKKSSKYLKKQQKTANACITTDASDTNVQRPDGDTIATQVQATSIKSSSCMIKSRHKFASTTSTNSNIRNMDLDDVFDGSSANLNKAIIEALQTVTKEQVRQVLEPIIQTLGSAFDKKNTSKTIESILSAFNSNVVSLTQSEYKRRHDVGKYEKGSKVKDDKVSGKTSANRAQQQYATKALKAAKHTKKLRQRKCYESSSAVNRNEANDVDDGDDDDDDGGVDADDDDVDDNDYYNKGDDDDDDGGYKDSKWGDGGRGRGSDSANTKNNNKRKIINNNNKTKNKNFVKFDEFDTQEDDDDDDDGYSKGDGDSEDDGDDNDHSKKHDNEDNKAKDDDGDDDDEAAVESSAESKLSVTASESESDEEGKSYHSFININNDFNAVIANKQHNINVGSGRGGNGSNSHHKKNKHLEQQQQELELQFQQHIHEHHQQHLKQQKQRQKHRDVKPANYKSISGTYSSPEMNGKVLKCSNYRRTTRKSALTAYASNDAGQKRHKQPKVFRKRRHPLLPPPPVPAGTPSTSARRSSARESNENGAQMEQFWSAVENHRSSSDADAGGGDTQENNKSELVPFTNAFNLPGNENFCILNNFNKMRSRYIDDAITKCLFNRQETEYGKNMGSTSDGAGDEKLHNKQPISNAALHIEESPYLNDQSSKSQKKLHQKKLIENQIRQKMEERQYKEFQKQQKRKSHNQNEREEKEFIDVKESDLKCTDAKHAHTNRSHKSERKPDLKVESMVNERNGFLKLCSKNRFYSNPNYNEPWKVFSKISHQISDEIIGSIEKDFSIGVSKFVQDFLEAETHN